VQKKKINNYGIASWVCFRAKPEESDYYLSLEDVIRIAESVGGKNHHLHYI